MFYLLEKKIKIFVWNTGAFWSAVTLFKPCSSRKVVVTPSPHCNHTPLSVLQPKLFLKGTDQNKEENKGGRGGEHLFPLLSFKWIPLSLSSLVFKPFGHNRQVVKATELLDFGWRWVWVRCRGVPCTGFVLNSVWAVQGMLCHKLGRLLRGILLTSGHPLVLNFFFFFFPAMCPDHLVPWGKKNPKGTKWPGSRFFCKAQSSGVCFSFLEDLQTKVFCTPGFCLWSGERASPFPSFCPGQWWEPLSSGTRLRRCPQSCW